MSNRIKEKNPTIKMRVLKKHNWFVCLFSKKKREERKRWEARWGKHLTEAHEIEIIPMKYEPHKPFYSDYKYKNTENDVNKNEWITNRKPTEEDADDQGVVWATFGDTVRYQSWYIVEEGMPWQPTNRPKPYVKPKRYKIIQFDNAEWGILRIADDKYVAHGIVWNAREAAERIAAIYEEVMP